MAGSCFAAIKHWFQRRGLLKSGNVLATDEEWDEESLPHFDSWQFYPVKVGDKIQGRYKILGKLGFGATSTVWFCEDKREKTYKVIKVCTHENGRHTREWEAYEHLKNLDYDASSPCASSLRECLDMFDIKGPTDNNHHCFVFFTAACSVQLLWKELIDGSFHITQIKLFVRHTLLALDFLHTKAHIIHTDIKPDNILFGLADTEALKSLVKMFKEHPPIAKRSGTSDYFVYRYQYMGDLGYSSWSHPVLGDLGEAHIVDETEDEYYGNWLVPKVVGPEALQAPETLLGCVWSYPVDIWMLGAMVLWMLENRLPFTKDNPGEDELAWHLAQIHALLGPLPAKFLKVLKEQPFWDEKGDWIHPDVALPNISLMQKLERIDEADKAETVDFLLCMLKWLPKERWTAAQLLEHPWLKSLFD